MPRRLTFAAVVLSLAVAGCAGTWQRVYASARTSADFIDATHERGWSEPLRVRVAECGESLPEHASPDQVDVCLGPFAFNAEVLAAVEAYDAAADVLAAALLTTDPRGDQAPVLAAWADVLAAARAFVARLPDGDRYLKQLDALTRGARRPS